MTKMFNCLNMQMTWPWLGSYQKTNPTHRGASLRYVSVLQDWCQASYLEMNVAKTKELVVHTKGVTNVTPVVLNNQPVEVVDHFKYLGTTIDHTLSFNEHSDSIFKRANQRLFLIRKLKSFGVSSHILEMAYRGLVESILQFNIAAWYGNLNVRQKNKLSSIMKTAGKVVGKPHLQLGELFNGAVVRKARQISGDTLHPLHSQFELLPSGRKFRVPRVSRNIYKKSFIPYAIHTLKIT